MLKDFHEVGCPWYDIALNYGVPHIKYCEAPLCSFISEPANTWSNLSYIILGLWLCYKLIKVRPLFLNALWLVLLGIMSFIFHMSNTYPTQLLDYIGMLLFLLWPVTLDLIRYQYPHKKAYALYVLGIFFFMGLVHIMHLVGYNYQILILVVGLMIAFTHTLVNRKLKAKVDYRYFKMSLLFLIVAQSFSIMDMKRIMCNPDNHILQGHGLWHLFSAIGLSFCILHWRQFFTDKSQQS